MVCWAAHSAAALRPRPNAMIENLETLIALSKTGTMMEASTALRISQSAVSKRIAALERYYDRDLIQRHGRRVVLTHHGTRLVERVTPLLSELRSVFLEDNALRKGKPNCRQLLWLHPPELCSSGDSKKNGCHVAVTTQCINCFPILQIRRFLKHEISALRSLPYNLNRTADAVDLSIFLFDVDYNWITLRFFCF